MIEETIQYQWYDYIDRIIQTNGWMYHSDDPVYWEGYKIFIRADLNAYESVMDWSLDNHMNEMLSSNLDQYVYRKNKYGHESIVPIGYESLNIWGYNNIITPSIRKYDIFINLKDGIDNWMYEITRKYMEKSPSIIPTRDELDEFIQLKLDKDSNYAKRETIRYELNLQQFNSK